MSKKRVFGASYFGVRKPNFVKKDLIKMKESGFNAVVHTYSENDFEYYEDTLKNIIKFTKEIGLEVYLDPWGLGRVFGGESYSHFALRNDSARQRFANGKKAPAICPNSPEFKKYLKRWVDSALVLGADYILWDEPHFFYEDNYGVPGNGMKWVCRCENCQRKFEEKLGHEMPLKYNRDIKKFKEESIFELIKYISTYVLERGGKNALVILPIWDMPDEFKAQLSRYANIGTLEILGSDPYFSLFDRDISDFKEQVDILYKAASNSNNEFMPQVWIQGFNVDKDSEDEVANSLEYVLEKGIPNVMIWSYCCTQIMSSISPERPKQLWHKLENIIKKAKSID